MERKEIMKLWILSLSFCFTFPMSSLWATPIKPPLSEKALWSQWKKEMELKVEKSPEFKDLDFQLRLSEKKEQQSFYFWTPDLQVYGSQTATQDQRSFSQKQWGLAAQLNLFQFGKDYYLYQSRQANLLATKSYYQNAYMDLENQYLNILFKNIFLLHKLELYTEIEALKKNTLKVAEQRFDRGNLPRQQVDKVAIDLANFESQKIGLEKELNENSVLMKKYELMEITSVWPLLSLKDAEFKPFENKSSLLFTQLENETLEAEQLYNYEKSQYWPSLDLSGRYYKFVEDTSLPNQWELSLTVTWKLWDKYAQNLNVMDSYRKANVANVKWNQYKNNLPNEQDNIFTQIQLSQKRLKKSLNSLTKLHSLYQDSEKLFSQGRMSVNELFQDQQLLMETKINFENDILDFHQNLLSYCKQKSLRIWDCF